MTVDIVTADVLEWARTYDGPPFYAMLSDPPYHLTNRRIDAPTCRDCGRVLGGADLPATECPRCGGEIAYIRNESSGGFMGKQWDGGGIAFDPATWAALAEHLLPGAFMFVFASSRGWHRLAVALEDAGLIMHPSVFLWAFGSGFPKATRVNGAADFNGHRYGRQALKPAVEPILCFQKPYAGRPVECIMATGAGALWVDGGRVPTGENVGRDNPNGPYRSDRTWNTSNTPGRNSAADPPAGRWPPNFALIHSPECEWVGVRRVRGNPAPPQTVKTSKGYPGGSFGNPDACRPDGVEMTGALSTGYADADGLETVSDWRCVESCPVRRLGEQSGERAGMKPNAFTGLRKFTGNEYATDDYSLAMTTGEYSGHADTGTAARFFPNPDWQLDIAERIAAADPVLYAAKTSRAERNRGLPDGTRSTHPTVKPISLAIWLSSLLLPPDAYAPRRILIPFAGSMSEAISARLAGWEHVTAIEQDPEYVKIGRARLAWWEANRDKAPRARAMGQSPRAAERASDPTGATRRDRMHGGNCANGAARAPMLPGLEPAP